MARSRAYPGFTLEKAIDSIDLILQNLGRGWHDRDTLAQGLGYRSCHGRANRHIASLVHFGLMDRDTDGYNLTDLSNQIVHYRDLAERTRAIRTAFHQPTLFRELVERYAADGRVPNQLANMLVRDHGVTPKASEDVAQIFLSSGVFAGVLSDDGTFASEDANTIARTDETASVQEAAASGSGVDGDDASDEWIGIATDDRDENSSQRFVFSLTGGRRASLVVPATLTPRDVTIIRKQIELLELQAEEA